MTRTPTTELRHAALERARLRADLVRIERSPQHADRVDGYVVAIGEKWALVLTVRDGGYSDGWCAIRIADIVRVRGDDGSFQRRVSAQQPWWPPTSPFPVDLDRTADLLASVPADELIGIEKEHRRSALWIGRVDAIDRRRAWLHEVDPRAEWHDDVAGYRLGAITRVQLRTEYLTGLSSVLAPRVVPRSRPHVDAPS